MPWKLINVFLLLASYRFLFMQAEYNGVEHDLCFRHTQNFPQVVMYQGKVTLIGAY